ncbi:hypothetical protein ACIGXM_08760 [Kitasatospora sp. NPDC052896]|uniref:hypothetical protein n=1 Tax=Kitasatospora sp. NPDC052896 TaxID=3364061 RepID=UPI0037CB7AC6
MPTMLDVKPVDEIEQQVVRVPLETLSAQGADRLTAAYRRALPADDSGLVPVAAFNSSI